MAPSVEGGGAACQYPIVLRRVPWLALLLGVAALVAARRSFIETQAFLSNAVRIEGRVIAVDERSSCSSEGGCQGCDEPTIQFSTADGRSIGPSRS